MSKTTTQVKNVSKLEAVKIADKVVKTVEKSPAVLLLERTQTAYKEVDSLLMSVVENLNSVIAISSNPDNLIKDKTAARFLHLTGKIAGSKNETQKKFSLLLTRLEKDATKADNAKIAKVKTAEKIKALQEKIANLS